MFHLLNARLEQAAGRQPELIRHRRHLHRNPEVGLELPDTHEYLAEALAGLGLRPRVHPGAGVTAVVRGRAAGPVAILRSDMDALPVQEASGEPFASQRPGAMHACGHDLHMAMLLGAAACLAEEPPAHDTVLVFQPGEEADRGAVPTLAAHPELAVTEATAFAVHVHATWESGRVFTRPGTFMAYGDWFRIGFRGPGGHASQPHLAGNPIVAGADLVLALREEVARLRGEEFLVATVTESLMGNTVNVIPAHGSLRGTLRTFSPRQRDALLAGLRRIAAEAAAANGLAVEVEVIEGYPAVVNHEEYVAGLTGTLAEAGIPVGSMPEPSTVIEDFAYFLQCWPGAMVYLGAAVPGRTAFNHSADVVFDEAVLTTGAALHLIAAEGGARWANRTSAP